MPIQPLMLSRRSLRTHLVAMVLPLVATTAAAGVVAASDNPGTAPLAAVAGATLAAVVFAAWVGRRLSRSAAELAVAAEDLATGGVEAVVASLRGDVAHRVPRPDEIDHGACSELRTTADALNHVAKTLVEVAGAQQDALRTGISELFVNLARRNQALLDRQIEFIDHLEANEEDPDQLEQLFRLDHLATRMRRNAESLLVLAGAEMPRARARDVAVEDVVRVAVGEIEDFGRIGLLGVDGAQVAGAVAVDLAHLLAELVENGTQYSPADQPVDVIGHRAGDGGYVLTVADRGPGMDDGAVAAANRTLARPPAVGLAMSRSLGFVVVGTLAARHDIVVRIERSAFGGLTAQVSIPARLVTDEPTLVADVVEPGPSVVVVDDTELVELEDESVADLQLEADMITTEAGWTASGEYVVRDVPEPAPIEWSPERVPVGAASPTRLADALPEGDEFDAGLYGLLQEENGPDLYDPIFDDVGED